MKRFVLFFCLVCIIAANVHAGTRRVGFFGPPVANVDYSTFAAAYTAAVNGDTILVFPGVTNISQTIAKKLFIFGPGDWLDSLATPKGNAYLQATTGNATVNTITFASGSDGSIMMGFYGGTYNVQTSYITIARNRELGVTLLNGNYTYTNLKLLENYRLSVSANGVYGGSVSSLIIANNLMNSFSTIAGNTYSGTLNNNVFAYDYTLATNNVNGGTNTMSSASTIELGNGQYAITGNIFVSFQSATVSSNYLRYNFGDGSNCIYNYNLALETATPPNWGAGTGNIITPIANVSNIFVGFPAIGTYSADARYKLAAGSPAATAAAGGPIGMFAGNAPYKLGLIPPIPTIYKLSSPQGVNPTGSTITINVSTRGNN